MMQELNKFCSDPTLVELLELAKSTDDLLDLLTPRENQHSDLMEWCFNAREGHGQGDAILKDFLLALYRSSSEHEAGDRLSGRGLSRDFVRAWPPTRVMASSFATAFCYREYALPKAPDEKNARRLDMLVIDPDNEFILVIENKAGARFGAGQLEGYLEGMQKTLLGKRAFSNFHVAFVAMDRDAAVGDDAAGNGTGIDGRWIRLNYEWLRPAAQRAEVAVQRGNQSAALLLSYCRRQTGWESESMQAMTRLAQDLAIRFPQVAKVFDRISKEFSHPDSWVPSMMKPDDIDGQLVKFYRQYESAIDLMLQLTPLQLLRASLTESVPDLENDEDAYEYGRVWASYRLPLDHPPAQVDYRWPLYLQYRYLNPGSDSAAKFRVRLLWRPCYVSEDERDRTCSALGKFYPPAATSADRQTRLILVEEECVFGRALDLGLEIIHKTSRALTLQSA
ncbi:PD-(D/E)XK nuclease family protein [Cupriavidus sp. IK-TO18]|uniref:PDDEXK-like family protein n=1 Tax=Cupriavidus sp. IK-TO18 TaxID=2782182 RepID=UPI00189C130C|nr:PD-(D/E)XK nuclease family protein [Cupriavidus sp. IK-TO18]MBF6992526.1 PD-(D/E)XK nuclease family protein [Cupriavidus sp. IK-TO18]